MTKKALKFNFFENFCWNFGFVVLFSWKKNSLPILNNLQNKINYFDSRLWKYYVISICLWQIDKRKLICASPWISSIRIRKKTAKWTRQTQRINKQINTYLSKKNFERVDYRVLINIKSSVHYFVIFSFYNITYSF